MKHLGKIFFYKVFKLTFIFTRCLLRDFIFHRNRLRAGIFLTGNVVFHQFNSPRVPFSQGSTQSINGSVTYHLCFKDVIDQHSFIELIPVAVFNQAVQRQKGNFSFPFVAPADCTLACCPILSTHPRWFL